MSGEGHTALGTLNAVLGIAASIVTLLVWANVTPEMVGEAVYRRIYIIIPFAMLALGAWCGWSITRLWADIRLSDERARLNEEICALEDELTSRDARISELEAELAEKKRAAADQEPDPLEAEALEAFRLICSTCYYDDDFSMVEPVVFTLKDAELSAIGLSERGVRLAEEHGLIRIEGKTSWFRVDRLLKGKHPGLSEEPDPAHDNERGIRMRFKGLSLLVRPALMENLRDSKRRGVEEFIRLGVVSFTVRGRELAATLDIAPNAALRGYLENGMK